MNIKPDTIIYPLPDEKLIGELEEYGELSLPKDYKEFIMNFGGGEPIEQSFIHKGHDYAIIRFLCLLDDPDAAGELGWYDIEVTESQIGERLTENEDLIGVEILPIAELFAGDLLCLDFRKTPDAPTVCIWYHEESEDFAPVTSTVAKSFTEFLGMLYDGLAE